MTITATLILLALILAAHEYLHRVFARMHQKEMSTAEYPKTEHSYEAM